MDAQRFDRIVRSLTSSGTRRGLLQFLTMLPLLGGLATLLGADEAGAKGRRKRRKKKHKHGKGRRRDHGRTKCKAESRAKVCAGKCGAIKNNCKKVIDCGSCACDPPCAVCLTCQDGPNTPGVCVPDPNTVGNACGGAGQVCQAAGVCACQAGSCPDNAPICDAGVCVPCTSDTQCESGGLGDHCCSGLCRECCGDGDCSGATPACHEGTCVCGDVCADGCRFSSLQAAIDTLPADTIIRLCAETYGGRLTIRKNLSIRGVGEGLDGTILDGLQIVATVTVFDGATVALDDLRVTGGSGGGVYVFDGTITMTNCTITENSDPVGGGGLYTPGDDATAILTNCTISHNTVGFSGGGIYNPGGSVTLNDTIITENEAGRDGGGIWSVSGGTVVFNGTSVVCGNRPDQCLGDGYTNPNCPELCPPP